MSKENALHMLMESVLESSQQALADAAPDIAVKETGTVTYVGQGIVRMSGLPDVQVQEIVTFESGAHGVVLDLSKDEVAAVLFEQNHDIEAGEEVYRTERLMDVPVGDYMLGRVIDPLGRPLDGKRG